MNFETREILTNSSSSFQSSFYDSTNNSSDISMNSLYVNQNATINLKKVVGLYIQYGIIQGYDSDEIVHLSYFDENPLEPRYYMFGSYESKVYVYDINVKEMTRDEEAQLRCSSKNLDYYDHIRCKNLCHDNCIGCYKSNSSLSCLKCRYDSMVNEMGLVCLESCARGYEKDTFLHSCIDIDECKRNDTVLIYKNKYNNQLYKWERCSNEGSVCINKIGSYECKCLSGYKGDGYICKDIDECSEPFYNNCTLNSVCTNLPGSFKCDCNDGYKLINSHCKDVNECEENIHECQINSRCINTIGSYRCICERGFKGNGAFCQGKISKFKIILCN
jgi:hypothetical protein